MSFIREAWQLAAAQFQASDIVGAQQLGGGNINLTWLITVKGGPPFILQRIHPQVFSQPEQLCRNMLCLEQAWEQWLTADLLADYPWQMPRLRQTKDGKICWFDRQGNLWRAMSYIANSRVLTEVQSGAMARSIGRGLALFHQMTAGITLAQLAEPIPHFHDTPYYLALLRQGLERYPRPWPGAMVNMVDFINERQEQACLLARERATGRLATTVTHGDPKLANFLFRRSEPMACALIDLDTVGPGLRLYDLGDCLRSCAASLPEDGQGEAVVSFDLALARDIIKGYCQQGPELLQDNESTWLARAIWLLPLELAGRFLCDFLTGNGYFKTSYATQNLDRAKGQLALVQDIEAKFARLQGLVQEVVSECTSKDIN